MLAQRKQQMRSIPAAKEHYVTCSLAFGSLLRRNRAAATQRAAASLAADEQQQLHTPHVSVLLQEVLANLNHMPIQVGQQPCSDSLQQQLGDASSEQEVARLTLLPCAVCTAGVCGLHAGCWRSHGCHDAAAPGEQESGAADVT